MRENTEREKTREIAGNKAARTGLSALVAKKKKWTGVLAEPLSNWERRRRGIGREDDRERPRTGKCGK